MSQQELPPSSSAHHLFIWVFFKAQGVLKDISVELLQHLDQGTAFIQVSTKLNPRGEIRGKVMYTRLNLFFFSIKRINKIEKKDFDIS